MTTADDVKSAELADEAGLRGQLRHAVRRTAAHLGVEPRLALEGPLDALAPEGVRTDLQAVLYEALANVAGHSHVTMLTVEVVADAGAGKLRLTVRDDGQNVARRPDPGAGLADIAARARRWHGGDTVHVRTEGGTEVRWVVPLPSGAPVDTTQ